MPSNRRQGGRRGRELAGGIQRAQKWARAASSWDLLRVLFPWGDRPTRLPMIAARETFRVTALPGYSSRLKKIFPLLLAAAGALYLVALVIWRTTNVPFCLNGLVLAVPLIVLAPSLLLWALPLALALAPPVAREREARTWEVLRTTPLTTEEILLSKAQGALTSLRRALRPIWHAQLHILAALLVGAGATLLLSGGLLATDKVGMLTRQNPLCLGAPLVVVATLAAYLLDRVQQFVLMAVAALAASTAASSVRAATSAAIGAVLVTWGAEVAVGAAWLLAQPSAEVRDLALGLLASALLGPPLGYLMELSPGMVALAMLGTLGLRGLALRLLWRQAIRRAERI